MKCSKRLTRILRVAGIVAMFSFCSGTSQSREPSMVAGQLHSISAIQPRQQKRDSVERYAATSSPHEALAKQDGGKGWLDYWPAAAIVALFASIFAVFKYVRRNPDAQKKKIFEKAGEREFDQSVRQQDDRDNEKRYKDYLKGQLGRSRIIGMPGLDGDSSSVDLLETFVQLDLDKDVDDLMRRPFEGERVVRSLTEHECETAEDALAAAIGEGKRMLVIIGEPGAGKSTIIRRFALSDHCKLPGASDPLRVSYLPLHVMKAGEVRKSLDDKLAGQCGPHLGIAASWFAQRLLGQPSLVLLDGLDEVGDPKQRELVCSWITTAANSWPQAVFVLTTRDKGYAALERDALPPDKRHAYVKRFNDDQQLDFLNKWFAEVLRRQSRLSQPMLDDSGESAAQKAKGLYDYLARDEHRGLKSLAGIPLLLQFMAMLWNQSSTLPERREDLYRIALDYMLDYVLVYREKEKKIDPLLPATVAKEVLAPVALWIQEEVGDETVEQDKFHYRMEPSIGNLDSKYSRYSAKEICENLVERVSVIDASGTAYQFRHKTFREYLAAMQLLASRDDADAEERLQRLTGCVGDPWWDEVLLFFMAQVSPGLFEKFIRTFFASQKSERLDESSLTFLKRLVAAPTQKPVSVFGELLADVSISSIRQGYLLDCLKVIGGGPAVGAAQAYMRNRPDADKNLLRKAAEVVDITAMDEMFGEDVEQSLPEAVDEQLGGVWQSGLEPGMQYITIPEGSYVSKGRQEIEVRQLQMAKYPVTNRLYRRFMAYLQARDNESTFGQRMPLEHFKVRLSAFAAGIVGFTAYLDATAGDMANCLRSRYDDDRRFNGDEQPVVGVSWYDARAYCLWLSLVESGGEHDDLYRLPVDTEWAWAAGGGTRKYPWGDPDPDETRANYGGNVGATTPVGIYPAGATPEGLYDMAGNVWEWQENRTDKDKVVRALRGGSWFSGSGNLRCDERSYDLPDLRNILFGFRVVRPSPF
jgi:formylglycine-generating enzyme required for sulfatase activity